MYKVRKRGRIYWMFLRTKNDLNAFSLKLTNKLEAEKLAEAIYKDRLNNEFGVTVIEEISLKQLLDRYLEFCRTENKESTADKKRFNVSNILNFFGDVPLTDITEEKIEKFKVKRIEMDYRSKKVSKSTVNHDLITLKHALNLAVRWGYLSSSPVENVKKYKVNNARNRVLEEEEQVRLIRECSPELKKVIIIAIHTGMRKGEILNLRWDDVDLFGKRIRVIDSKNNEQRVIPINAVLYAMLNEIEPKLGLVFCSRYGDPYKSVDTGFRAALKRAGITNFRFHDLRHTCGTRLAMKGATPQAIGTVLGHKTLQMTMRYTHLSPDYLGKVMDTLVEEDSV